MTSNKNNPSLEAFVSCPVCSKVFDKSLIEEHVNRCLFLNASEENNSKQNPKRSSSHLLLPTQEKRARISTSPSSSKSVVNNIHNIINKLFHSKILCKYKNIFRNHKCPSLVLKFKPNQKKSRIFLWLNV